MFLLNTLFFHLVANLTSESLTLKMHRLSDHLIISILSAQPMLSCNKTVYTNQNVNKTVQEVINNSSTPKICPLVATHFLIYQFWEFTATSRVKLLPDKFGYSPHLFARQCMDVIERIYILITSRVKKVYQNLQFYTQWVSLEFINATI